MGRTELKIKTTGIILVAGNSTRYNKDKNKNLEMINNKYVFEYSLEVFLSNPNIDDIIIAARKDEINRIKEIISKNTDKSILILEGGKTRSESVYNCIISTDSDVILIHDGARPLIKQNFINDCIHEIKKFDGVTVAIKTKDTIKISDDNNIVISTTKRNNTWQIQTPQCFKREVLLEAFKKYGGHESITDDCMLLEMIGKHIKLVGGDYTNIKVTTPEDMAIAKLFLSLQ